MPTEKSLKRYMKIKGMLNNHYDKIKIKKDLDNIKRNPRKIRPSETKPASVFAQSVEQRRERLMTPEPYDKCKLTHSLSRHFTRTHETDADFWNKYVISFNL
jgi:hypothetical protein